MHVIQSAHKLKILTESTHNYKNLSEKNLQLFALNTNCYKTFKTFKFYTAILVHQSALRNWGVVVEINEMLCISRNLWLHVQVNRC